MEEKQIFLPYNNKIIEGSFFTIKNPNINLPYILFIPKNMNENSQLVVSCLTQTSSDVSFDETIKKIEKEFFDNQLYKYNGVGEIITELNYPVLFPLIPRFRGADFTFLSSQVRNNEVSNLDEKTLNNIKYIDNQVYDMIMDSNKRLNIDRKVIITGYSAGAHFANSFTALHPEIVDIEICGGQAGLQIQPYNGFEGEKLNFPLGFSDIGDEKLKEYKKVSHFFYMGKEDNNDPAEMIDGKAKYLSKYTDNEVKQIDKLYKGKTPQQRFKFNKEIYSNLTIDAIYKEYAGNHITVQQNKEVRTDIIKFIQLKNKKQELTNEKPYTLKYRNSNGSIQLILLTIIAIILCIIVMVLL